MTDDEKQSQNVLIGEYVLGLLEGSAATDAADLIERDPQAARLALEWERRFLALADRLEPISPNPNLWQRVSRSVFETVVPSAQPAVASAPASAAPRKPRAPVQPSLWERLSAWRWLSAGLATAVLALLLLSPGWWAGGDADRTQVAVLQPPGEPAKPGWVLRVRGNGDVELQPLMPQPTPQGQSVELWTLAPGEAKPRSLGLVDPGQPITVQAGQIGDVVPGQLFEMTVEPAGGSPTGGPTGPILFIGRTVVAALD